MARRSQEAALAELLNKDGQFYGTTLSADWRAPERVEVSGGVLTIRGTHPYWHRGHPARLIRPPGNLLDAFVSLAGVSGTERVSLRDLVRGSDPSDDKICAFASRYGGLQIFYWLRDIGDWPVTEHLEYCDIWRYFAGTMGALLRIAAKLYRGERGSQADWEIIHKVPPLLQETAFGSQLGTLQPFPMGNEKNWLALAHFAGKPSQQNRAIFSHMMNTLLGLGGVRPWFSWSEASRSAARPGITYSSQSLLSQLVLQLCLRVAKVDSFLVCTHCQQSYSPVVRAPKAGQRNFCPACRAAGVPQKYALRDFRHRQSVI
jgi:hypothetical protein